MPGTLSPQQVEALLHQQFIGRLGCFSADDIYVVPISYAYDGEYIYGHSYTGTKIAMMRQNPRVCVQVDASDSMFNWQSVIAWGNYEELTTAADRQQAQQVLFNKTLPFAPPDLNAADVIIFRIKLNRKSGRFNSTPPQEERPV